MWHMLKSTIPTQRNIYHSTPDVSTMKRCGPSDARFSYFLRGGRYWDIFWNVKITKFWTSVFKNTVLETYIFAYKHLTYVCKHFPELGPVHKASGFNHCAIKSDSSYFSLSSKLTNWMALAKNLTYSSFIFLLQSGKNNASVCEDWKNGHGWKQYKKYIIGTQRI